MPPHGPHVTLRVVLGGREAQVDPSGAPARARPARRVHDGAVGSVRGRTVLHVQGLQGLQTISGGKVPGAFIFSSPLLKSREKKILDSLYPFSIEKYARCAKCAVTWLPAPFARYTPSSSLEVCRVCRLHREAKSPGFLFYSTWASSRAPAPPAWLHAEAGSIDLHRPGLK